MNYNTVAFTMTCRAFEVVASDDADISSDSEPRIDLSFPGRLCSAILKSIIMLIMLFQVSHVADLDRGRLSTHVLDPLTRFFTDTLFFAGDHPIYMAFFKTPA